MSAKLTRVFVWVASAIALMSAGVGRSQTPIVEFEPPQIELPDRIPFSSYMSHGGPRCPNYYTHALIPQSQSGLTAQSSPVLYFHADDRGWESPDTETIVLTLEVWEAIASDGPSDIDLDRDRPIYEDSTVLETSNLPGIVSFAIPDTVENAMQVDRVYEWVLQIDCTPDGDDSFWEESDRIGGWIVRTDNSELAMQLEGKTAMERAAIYAENGIWFDAIATVAQLRVDNPEDEAISMAWHNLLSYAELDFLFDAPFYPRQKIDDGRALLILKR